VFSGLTNEKADFLAFLAMSLVPDLWSDSGFPFVLTGSLRLNAEERIRWANL
jgi:hypothetical protein